jgi:hypothetical protein
MSDWKRFVYAADVHGEYQEKEPNEALFKFIGLYKPDIRICGGDVWNMGPIRKKADKHEKRESMKRDYIEGKIWLERFKPHYFLRGNHDERIFDLAEEEDGIIKDHAENCVEEIETLMRKLRCRMLPYSKRSGILKLGHLHFAHGFKCGINAAREQARTYHNIVVGHGHGIQAQSIEGLEPRCGWMSGCLCQLDQKYNRGHTGSLVHEHGWAYGLINQKTGDFQYLQARKAGKQWMLATEFVTL